MGLTMGEKKALTRETAAGYRAADKQAKHTILDEFTQVTGYHRKYRNGSSVWRITSTVRKG